MEAKTKPCPKCEVPIPENWNRHFECKWNCEDAKNYPSKVPEKTLSSLMLESLIETKAIRNSPELGDLFIEKIDWSAVSISLFIAKTREGR